MGLKTYLLIRIGLDVEENRWFGTKLEWEPGTGELKEASAHVPYAGNMEAESAAGKRPDAAETARDAGSIRGEVSFPVPDECRTGLWDTLCHPWKTIRRKRAEEKRKRTDRAKRLAQEQEEARLRVVRKEALDQAETMICRLAREVEELAQDVNACRCVYEDSIRRALIGERTRAKDRIEGGRDSGEETQTTISSLWQKHFPLEEFHDYTQKRWMEQLFQRATAPHFILLGTAEGIFPLIEAYADRMKSLRWILVRAQCDEKLYDFVEDFYTEYGLAIELQLLENEAALKRMRFFGREAVSIVDFTGEVYMAVSAVPEGSIWLDMFSVEEKKRRILAREKKVAYISMKEIWKIAQKRCNCPVLP